MFFLGPNSSLTLSRFSQLLYSNLSLGVSPESVLRLDETRAFIDYLLQRNIRVYGLTTGFADLRNEVVPSEKAAELSRNIIASHDAGIGSPLPSDVVLGAMIARANSLSKGLSGFQTASLNTLVAMINARVVPEIPCHGSLGASGDLALLARLGQAMQGCDVPVTYQEKKMTAGDALKLAGITPFVPKAKEGLALTNGTSFMSSMSAVAVLKEIALLENVFALLPLFLSAVGAVDAAFYASIQTCRNQEGQKWVAALLTDLLKDAPLVDRRGVQDDYCIRCLPQILGPKLELILWSATRIERELEAVTDNPLIFRGEEISSDANRELLLEFQDANWLVVSGGNFHGEYLTMVADSIALANAKIAILLERHMTYLLNPFRNKGRLPAYLIQDEKKKGLYSGYMITQYTGNDLAQKICYLGNSVGIFNATSGNESEDVVSYGSSACQRLLTQISYFEDFLAIYIAIVSQAYSMKRISSSTFSERCFALIQEYLPTLPHSKEESFTKRYEAATELMRSRELNKLINFPIMNQVARSNDFNNHTCGDKTCANNMSV